uniref:CENPP protein n=1 Tax=Dromaius novaehollandiae TaxID=8790 RepID=A0A8C4JFX7_DRONO
GRRQTKEAPHRPAGTLPAARGPEDPPAPGDNRASPSPKSFQGEFQRELKGYESPSDLKVQLESLETDLSFLMKFTGIRFTTHSKKTVEKSKTIQKHRLSGNCHSLPFQLEFQLLEIKNKESVSAVITDLNIIMESGEYSGVSKFVYCKSACVCFIPGTQFLLCCQHFFLSWPAFVGSCD